MEEKEISIRQLLEIILRGKWIIALITVMCLVLGFAFTFVSTANDGQAETFITFNFPGIENGKNPDGTTFNVHRITSPVVLEGVIESLNLNESIYSTSWLNANIKITPVIPNDVVQKVEVALKRGESYEYHPVTYKLSLNIPSPADASLTTRISRRLGTGSSDKKAFAETFFTSLVEHYRVYFKQQHLNINFGVTPHKLDYESYDYLDIVSISQNHLTAIERFAKTQNENTLDFRSIHTGHTFLDIADRVSVIKDIDLNKLSSMIWVNGLTKNTDRLIKEYEYKIEMLQLEAEKKKNEARATAEMMAAYKKDDILVHMPGGTDANQISALNIDSYYDKLAERSIEALVTAQSLETDIRHYENEIEKLMGETISLSDKQKAEEELLYMISEVKDKMLYWINIANDMVQEYYDHNYTNIIRKISPTGLVQTVNIKLNLAISLVLGIMVGVFVVFFIDYWKNSKEDIEA